MMASKCLAERKAGSRKNVDQISCKPAANMTHKPYNTGLQSLNQFFLLSSHVRHFKLKIHKTPSRQLLAFSQKEHKQTNKKQLPQRAKNTVHKHRTPNQKNTEAQQK
jgi:hypothetical protein